MRQRFFTYTLFLSLLALSATFANADSVILKNGQVIRAVDGRDTDEKSVLREFYIQEANTLEMPVEDIVVSGLIKKKDSADDQGQRAVFSRGSSAAGDYLACGENTHKTPGNRYADKPG